MVQVKLFAVLREKAGTDNLSIPIQGPVKVVEFLELLSNAHPKVGSLISEISPRVAINHEFSSSSDIINDGDEVAIIPPVSGGSNEAGDRENTLVRIQEGDFSVDEAIDEVKKSSKGIGGISVFLGTARDFSPGHDVDWLEFEHYPGMAEAKLKEIRQRALDDFDIIEVLILHRYGRIEPGENIVLIVVGSSHRDQAFKACRFCIDELKEITPIWKKEVTPTGQVWVSHHP